MLNPFIPKGVKIMSHRNTNGSCSSDCGCNTGVTCEVVNCVYNRDKKYCEAPTIKVGPQYASNTAETNCATFQAK